MTMNATHWHALVNHIPVVGVPMIAILLVWGLAKANEAMVRLALLATVVMAGAAWLADNTGGKAEHEVKEAKLAWVSRHLIHEHEEVAEKAELVAIATGILALGVLVLARGGKPPHRVATYGVLLGLGLTAALLAVTAWKGGDIRHDEFGISNGNERLETPGEPEHEH